MEKVRGKITNIEEAMNMVRKFNECIKQAGEIRDTLHDFLEENDIDPSAFEEASIDSQAYWGQDFALSMSYEENAIREFLEKELEGKELER